MLREAGAISAAAISASGEKVNVEYVSANPTGPMHVGHCRGAVFGDALANLLAFAGYEVTREYYVNDAGAQVDVLARSAYLRYREALGEDIGAIPDGLYPGDYLKPVGEALAEAARPRAPAEAREPSGCRSCAPAAIDAMMAMIRERSRRARHPPRRVLLRALAQRRQDRRGRRDDRRPCARPVTSTKAACRRPRASCREDWEDREQTLFRSTEFGDDVDRPLMKSDGSYTYFAADIAYHREQVRRAASGT